MMAEVEATPLQRTLPPCPADVAVSPRERKMVKAAKIDSFSTDSGISSAISEEELEAAVSPSSYINTLKESSPVEAKTAPSSKGKESSNQDIHEKGRRSSQTKASIASAALYLGTSNRSSSNLVLVKPKVQVEGQLPTASVGGSQHCQIVKLDKTVKPNLRNRFEEVRRITLLLEKAVRNKRVFCLGGGHFPAARKAFLRRGWIEITTRNRTTTLTSHPKSPLASLRYSSSVGGGLLGTSEHGGLPMVTSGRDLGLSNTAAGSCFSRAEEAVLCGNPAPSSSISAAAVAAAAVTSAASDINLIILKENVEAFLKKESNFKKPAKPDVIYAKLTKNLLSNHEWCPHRRRIPWKSLLKDQVVNKFPTSFFTTKTGLHQSLQHLHWYSPQPVSTFFPRCYVVSNDDERQNFVDDYRLTACISILQWFCMEFKKHGQIGVESLEGKARRSVVEFSLLRCKEFVVQQNHMDVDEEQPTIWEHQWDQFILDFYLVCHENSKLQLLPPDASSFCRSTEYLFGECSKVLDSVLKLRSESIVDGLMNIWIIKPGSSSRGRGISMDMKLDNILSAVSKSGSGVHSRYVIQKYIERPFLIYETKFDIRQWFLVTSWNPLVIWMYKESYLRFCSRPFTLASGHESIHLCNNAVQAKYTNAERSNKLPHDNMWDNKTFVQFLREQGYGDKWDSTIYPLMKKTLIGTILANQDNMEFNYKQGSAYELYGADFLLSYDLNPWLIEINSSPALGSTTSVTARLCPQLLEDVARVTIDRKRIKNADTGAFELIYKQACVQPPLFVGTNLLVQGVKVQIANSRQLKGGGNFNKNYARALQQLCSKENSNSKLGGNPDASVSLKALLQLAKRSACRSNSRNSGDDGSPVIADLIDSIMSIPSCVQDSNSKVTLVREWIKQNPKSPSTSSNAEDSSDNLRQQPKRSNSSSSNTSSVSGTCSEPYCLTANSNPKSPECDQGEGGGEEVNEDMLEPYARYKSTRSLSASQVTCLPTQAGGALLKNRRRRSLVCNSSSGNSNSSKSTRDCYAKKAGAAAKKFLRNKTPFSSLPPPPVKKKNLTPAHNGQDYQRLIQVVENGASLDKYPSLPLNEADDAGQGREGCEDDEEGCGVGEDDLEDLSESQCGFSLSQPTPPIASAKKRLDKAQFSSFHLKNNSKSFEEEEKSVAGCKEPKAKPKNSQPPRNRSSSKKVQRRPVSGSKRKNSARGTRLKQEVKSRILSVNLDVLPDLLNSIPGIQRIEDGSWWPSDASVYAPQIKTSLHQRLHPGGESRKLSRGRLTATQVAQSQGSRSHPLAASGSAATAVYTSATSQNWAPTYNGHKFIKNNNGEPNVKPSLPTFDSLHVLDTTNSQGYDGCSGYGNESTSANSRNTSTTASKAALILSSIPLCGTQRCLIKYGCGHCL